MVGINSIVSMSIRIKVEFILLTLFFSLCLAYSHGVLAILEERGKVRTGLIAVVLKILCTSYFFIALLVAGYSFTLFIVGQQETVVILVPLGMLSLWVTTANTVYRLTTPLTHDT